MSRRAKGIGLLSGGLDSILAVKVLQDQNADLIALTFVTPFFGPEQGMAAGNMAGVQTRAVDISEIHLEMLKNPRYGYGSKLNPCIDCHGLMLREAAKVLAREGADFLFTGEVLGQRPMSQRRDSLRSVEKLSGLSGRILRPLSAKLLPPTIVEQEGLIDRSMLLAIHGRSRKPQRELALKYALKDYPQPGGGCMLTNESFANRLRKLLEIFPGAAVADVEIIKWGRAFLLPKDTICMVGRNESENLRLEALARARDIVLKATDYPGPTSVILAPSAPFDLEGACTLSASYSDAPQDTLVRIEWRAGGAGKDSAAGNILAKSAPRLSFKNMLV
ncbi:MAG: tRNA 4-thiouridine(8) synthase ThiI [Syntrophobacteraceae bacterium]